MIDFFMDKIMPIFIIICAIFISILMITSIPYLINGDAYCTKTTVEMRTYEK